MIYKLYHSLNSTMKFISKRLLFLHGLCSKKWVQENNAIVCKLQTIFTMDYKSEKLPNQLDFPQKKF